MKQFATLRWFMVALVSLLLLTACERSLGSEEPTDASGATPTAPLIINTIPAVTPTTQQAYPVVTQATDGTIVTQQPPTGETAVPPAEATVPPPAPTTAAGPTTHTVQAGDTLGAIAQQYGVSINDIALANNLANIDTLDVGQQLIIPAPGSVVAGTTTPPQTGEQEHIVQAGDNLYRIGLLYGFTVDELVTYNNLTNPDQLEVGQVIRIPSSN